jgi:hypothetical protein
LPESERQELLARDLGLKEQAVKILVSQAALALHCDSSESQVSAWGRTELIPRRVRPLIEAVVRGVPAEAQPLLSPPARRLLGVLVKSQGVHVSHAEREEAIRLAIQLIAVSRHWPDVYGPLKQMVEAAARSRRATLTEKRKGTG